VGIKANYATDGNYLRIKYGKPDVPREADELLEDLAEEERRVLYVAATRAKEQLYFCCVEKGTGKDVFQLLADLDPRIKIQQEESQTSFPSPQRPIIMPASLDPIAEQWEHVAASKDINALPSFVSITAQAR